MSASSTASAVEGALTKNEAFTAGSDLWVIENNPQLDLWHALDFASCSLLTENNLHTKAERSEALTQILEATRLETKSNTKPDSFILLGTSNHFKNKWTLLYSKTKLQDVAAELEKLESSLHFSSLRLFSDAEPLLKLLKTRPTASRLTISFIANT